jgi:hypothetical protein
VLATSEKSLNIWHHEVSQLPARYEHVLRFYVAMDYAALFLFVEIDERAVVRIMNGF